MLLDVNEEEDDENDDEDDDEEDEDEDEEEEDTYTCLPKTMRSTSDVSKEGRRQNLPGVSTYTYRDV